MAVEAHSVVRVPVREATLSPKVVARLGGVVVGLDVVAATGAALLVGPRDMWGLLLALAAVLSLTMTGHHRVGITPSVGADAPTMVGGLAVAVVAVGAVAPSGRLDQIIPAGLLLVVAVLVGRTISYASLRTLRRRGLIFEPTLIIGAGVLGTEVATVLRDHPEYGLVPVGFLDSFTDNDLPLPILGGPRALDAVLREHSVRRVIIAFGGTRDLDLVPVVRACERASVDIHVLPRFFELGITGVGRGGDDIWGIPLVRLKRGAVRPGARVMKRGFDLVVAGAAVIVAAPVLALISLAVRVTSPGPILFRQHRIGEGGRMVEILKFRTLRVNDDSDTTWSVRDDDRVTPIGGLLRRLSLDELPQLFNVLRGDMSLVGPRPERPFFVRRFGTEVPRYDDRHRVPVGLTGWAQVHGLRGDTSIKERARFDNQYIENWSLWWDVVVLVRTVKAAIRGDRA
jgi:exopolysaccharide biosynthesis polyprenyl glycosylphosphotransferase